MAHGTRMEHIYIHFCGRFAMLVSFVYMLVNKLIYNYMQLHIQFSFSVPWNSHGTYKHALLWRARHARFILVYIHPFMDGNGRIGRFLFNAMLASGGYPWIVIQVDKRKEYRTALEKASVGQDITDFVQFLSNLLSA
jgi:Fic family protein